MKSTPHLSVAALLILIISMFSHPAWAAENDAPATPASSSTSTSSTVIATSGTSAASASTTSDVASGSTTVTADSTVSSTPSAHSDSSTISASRQSELSQALTQASAARDLAKDHTSTTYPGIYKYIDGLIAKAEGGDYDESRIGELISALNDASSSTPLLLGVANNANTSSARQEVATSTSGALHLDFYKPSQSNGNSSSKSTSPAQSVEVPNTAAYSNSVASEANAVPSNQRTLAATSVATAISVTVTDTPEDDAVDAVSPDQPADSSHSDAIEIPQTGKYESRPSVIFLASIATVLALLISTVVVLKLKRRH